MHKFNTLNSSKLSIGRLYSNRSNIKSSKNHYDTLKIASHATQNEVKAAYYKLSLQYHPDKNKSRYAKEKFHDISEAYEVLGNHESRKKYDQNTMIHQSPGSTTAQEFTSPNKDKIYTGRSRIYNFDEWTHAHYEKQMHMYQMRRDMYEQYKHMENLNPKKRNSSHRIAEFMLLLLTVVVIAKFMDRSIDVPVYVTFQII